LKYGAVVDQDPDTVALVVDVIWQAVDRLADITEEKQLERLTANLIQVAATDSVWAPAATVLLTTVAVALLDAVKVLEDVVVGYLEQGYVVLVCQADKVRM
jgi:hypothetical protein